MVRRDLHLGAVKKGNCMTKIRALVPRGLYRGSTWVPEVHFTETKAREIKRARESERERERQRERERERERESGRKKARDG